MRVPSRARAPLPGQRHHRPDGRDREHAVEEARAATAGTGTSAPPLCPSAAISASAAADPRHPAITQARSDPRPKPGGRDAHDQHAQEHAAVLRARQLRSTGRA
jgi:hypothetical protein